MICHRYIVFRKANPSYLGLYSYGVAALASVMLGDVMLGDASLNFA